MIAPRKAGLGQVYRDLCSSVSSVASTIEFTTKTTTSLAKTGKASADMLYIETCKNSLEELGTDTSEMTIMDVVTTWQTVEAMLEGTIPPIPTTAKTAKTNKEEGSK